MPGYFRICFQFCFSFASFRHLSLSYLAQSFPLCSQTRLNRGLLSRFFILLPFNHSSICSYTNNSRVPSHPPQSYRTIPRSFTCTPKLAPAGVICHARSELKINVFAKREMLAVPPVRGPKPVSCTFRVCLQRYLLAKTEIILGKGSLSTSISSGLCYARASS